MSLVLLGIGTALPKNLIAQTDAAEIAKTFCFGGEEQVRLLPTLYRRTLVQKRGSVLLDEANGSGPKQSFFPPAADRSDLGPTTRQRMERYVQEAGPLALEAARRAFDEAKLPPRRISHLVTVSCTGFSAPGVDFELIQGLGLSPTIARTHVGFMGCHGAVNGLRVASAFAEADPRARVLLCAVELCSLHFRYGLQPEKMVANALFADGAAAAVASGGRSQGAWCVSATGSCLFPDSEQDMSWRVGDHGFEMTLSSRVPNLIAAHLRPWLEQWLRRQRITMRSVRSWAVHPGGPRILNSVVEALKLPESALLVSREVLAQCGNMSSPTILFILERLRREKAPRPCVALGFGPGLVVEGALLD